MTVVCIRTARAEVPGKLCVLSERYNPSKFLEKINLHFKIYTPKVGKQKRARRFSKQDGHVRKGSRGHGYPKNSTLQKARLAWGPCLCPLLLPAPRPRPPYLHRWLLPFSSFDALPSPYLMSLSLSLSSLCPLSSFLSPS